MTDAKNVYDIFERGTFSVYPNVHVLCVTKYTHTEYICVCVLYFTMVGILGQKRA